MSVTATAIGRRIRRLREAKGLSRTDLARKIDVDVSSISGWERGLRLPRDTLRPFLARALDCELEQLMSPQIEDDQPSEVTVLDVTSEFPPLFANCIRRARRTIKAMRLSSSYSTTVNVQTEARRLIGERIMAGDIEVQRVEIFYTLERLREVLSNILRYDGKRYYVKAYCVGLKEIAPFLSGYAFDDNDVVLGGYWTGYPPQHDPVLRIRGPAIRTFFASYWRETWGRGTLLNSHGGRDLSAVREVALAMGLKPRHWRRFVDDAIGLETGDDAPPLI
ncbi:helix-turn-helix domain-containing protein [Rhizomicrobium electricum]|jgi:transcriptional regulator with XRE-family HTH domain|uniref:HTH cro/C1-type domain-containing protein n=1 Tax=Rhizomicrobium electricum TaxID=480070 RepID=A0ABN1F6A0_9PROT|nr:helix-turn-helix domain-containing protein [Rhizomicrobium electricum]NIJ50442.1 transcriptional regulator with XRE-family HTH domain [Rhizomicrobium electricum]